MKNLKVVNAAVTNDIYLSNVLKDGTMGASRKRVTNEVLGAALTHVLTMQTRDEGFGMCFGTVHGDKILTVIPAEKLEVVKIAAGNYEPGEENDTEVGLTKHDMNRAYEVISDQQVVIQQYEKERIELDDMIDYLVGRMDGDRTELEAEFKRLGEME